MADDTKDRLDLNGPNFDPNFYLEKLFKECYLRQIMDHESELVKDIQTLHSDMQTLVYENYNKFISATDTIKKMKNDFKQMETEMDLLVSNMASITASSDQINATLQGNRQQINKLSGVHSLLQRLQFLFKLPASLKEKLEEKNYSQAVQDYMHAQRVLEQYGDLPSFQGIKSDSEELLEELRHALRQQFSDPQSTTKELADSVDLLLQLEEPPQELCKEFLSCSEKRLGEQLVLLKDQFEQRDIIDFVDLGCTGFLNDLCLVVASFHDMFINRSNLENVETSEVFENFASKELDNFVKDHMEKYFELVQIKVDSEQDVGDTSILVQALDRFYKRVESTNSLCVNVDFAKKANDIVVNAGRKQCKSHLQVLKLHFADLLGKIKHNLTMPKLLSQDDNNKNLNEILLSLILASVEKVRGILQDLCAFIQPNISFAQKEQFKDNFCVDHVREGLVVCYLHHLTATARLYCTTGITDIKLPPTLLLLLSKFCLEFRGGHVHALLSLTDDLFKINTKQNSALTTESEINTNMQESAQELLNYFVRMQGLNVSQMLRKSVETRDWLHTIEPRTVRAVMKRVIEDISVIDSTVALLYEDQGINTEHSSDSSRKTHSVSVSRHQFKSNWSTYNSNLDSALASNMHKLFNDRIEFFSTVQFNKVSILTGIIKISLKTFMECVRLKTFSKFGIQQIQVDTHYLQLYLWRFVADENLVHFLLDEILGSAVHRCLEPVLMEPSVVDIICERG